MRSAEFRHRGRQRQVQHFGRIGTGFDDGEQLPRMRELLAMRLVENGATGPLR